MKEYDVYGIGSALMDFLIEANEQVLTQFGLKKGGMHLIDEKQSAEMLRKIKEYNLKIAPGGSSANTLAAIALIGGKVVFCGKVGDDEHGYLYEKRMQEGRVRSNIAKGPAATGHAITFITPDSQRTFATHLGAAMHLKKEDLFEEDITKSKVLHIEGYQLEDKNLRETALHAMGIAKRNGTKISIDLADPGLIERNRDDLTAMVKQYADIVFANEEEAMAFTGKDAETAVQELAQDAEIAIVKQGAKGALIAAEGKVIAISAYKTEAVDTTGAGDVFAAGFLFGLTHGMPLEKSGKMGAYLAAKVVSKIGARLDTVTKEELAGL